MCSHLASLSSLGNVRDAAERAVAESSRAGVFMLQAALVVHACATARSVAMLASHAGGASRIGVVGYR